MENDAKDTSERDDEEKFHGIRSAKRKSILDIG